MINLERWKTLSKRDQLGHIAAEIMRARLIKSTDFRIYREMLERALSLVDVTFSDPKWRGNSLALLLLRDELAKAYVDENVNLEKIYAAL